MTDQEQTRSDVTVVTNENFNDYVNEKLGTTQTEEQTENPDPEKVAAEEFDALEAEQAAKKVAEEGPKEGDIDGANVFFNGKWVKKHDFNYRLHVKTEEARKEAQAKIEAAAAEAKTAREEAEAAAKERDELRAKYEPPKSDDIGPEPQPEQFQDAREYGKALKEWATEDARIQAKKAQAERDAADAQQKAKERWNSAEKALRDEIPDYDERLAKAPGAAVPVSNELGAAVAESEIGPKLKLHLAENPDLLKSLLGMTVGKMLKEVGKIEASLASPGDKQSKPAAKLAAVVEMSKAPPPITPIKGGTGAPAVKIDADGNFYGTFEEYKAARLAGKIK